MGLVLFCLAALLVLCVSVLQHPLLQQHERPMMYTPNMDMQVTCQCWSNSDVGAMQCKHKTHAAVLQVVPTMYSDVRNNTIFSNQYSVTEHFKRADIQQGQNMPGVFFFYDLSPIKVSKRCAIGTIYHVCNYG